VLLNHVDKLRVPSSRFTSTHPGIQSFEINQLTQSIMAFFLSYKFALLRYFVDSERRWSFGEEQGCA